MSLSLERQRALRIAFIAILVFSAGEVVWWMLDQRRLDIHCMHHPVGAHHARHIDREQPSATAQVQHRHTSGKAEQAERSTRIAIAQPQRVIQRGGELMGHWMRSALADHTQCDLRTERRTGAC